MMASAFSSFMEKKYQAKPGINSEHWAAGVMDKVGIPADAVKDIRVFDEKDGMILLHYVDEVPPVGGEHIRGVVVDMSGGEGGAQVVCRSFPCTPEFVIGSAEAEQVLSGLDPARCMITTAYEGTILRLFNVRGKWYLSTHRRIDGRNSKWSGTITFGKMFDELWGGQDYSMLDTNMCYTFLMVHPGNKLVCDAKEMLYHVSTYDRTTDEFVYGVSVLHPNVKQPDAHDVKTLDDLRETVSKMNWRAKTGVLIHISPNSVIKILSKDYYQARLVRGNEPNLRIVYLGHKMAGTRERLYEVMPREMGVFQRVESDLAVALDHLAEIYKQRYIEGQEIQVRPEDHRVLEKLRKSPPKGKFDIRAHLALTLETFPAHTQNAVIRNYIQMKKREEYEAKKADASGAGSA